MFTVKYSRSVMFLAIRFHVNGLGINMNDSEFPFASLQHAESDILSGRKEGRNSKEWNEVNTK